MSTGGSGFMVLTYRDARLAYLRVLKNVPPEPDFPGMGMFDPNRIPKVPPMTRGTLELEFYEIWNDAVWAELMKRYPRGLLRESLQAAIEAKELVLRKIQKTPGGASAQWIYDLSGCHLQELVDPLLQSVGVGGGLIGKTVRVVPYPSVVTHTYDAPPPPPSFPSTPKFTPDADTELPPIEVGRYALRTFNLKYNVLASLNQPGDWNGGGAEAKCNHKPPCDRPPSPGHRCGLYGTLTLAQLVKEYPRCEDLVAVFAAEGRTMLGTRGLRTERARVVAYWCKSLREKRVMEAQAPEARHFKTMPEMLKAYGFEQWSPAPQTRQGRWFAPYDPTDPQVLADWLRAEREWVRCQVTAQHSFTVGSGGSGGTWILPTTMTSAGRKALVEVWGAVASPSGCWNCSAIHTGPPGRCSSCAAQFAQHHGTKPIIAPLHCGTCAAVVDPVTGQCAICGPRP